MTTQIKGRANRPPLIHPTTAHAATATISRSGVCSIGRNARNAGTIGASRNALSPIASFRHDLRVLTGAAVAVMLRGVSLEIRNDREITGALDGS